MTDESNPPPAADPATIWWGSKDQTVRPQTTYRPPYIPSFQRRLEERWRWRYSWFFGIMYGRVPVGAIVVILLTIIYRL